MAKVELCGDVKDGAVCGLQAGHAGEWHSDGDEKWPVVVERIDMTAEGHGVIEVTSEDVREAHEAARIGQALALLAPTLTEAMDLLSKVRTALDDPAGLPDEEYEDFVDGHSIAADEEDALLQVSRNYAIAKLDEGIALLRFAGGRG